MPKLPSVTCLLSTYQYAAFLPDAIESALNQDYEGDVEVLVADDGSADDTPDIVACYPAVRYHRQDNTGVAGLINTALPLATGDLVAFHSGDDVWLPHKTSLQVAVLMDRPELGLVYGDMTVVDRDLNVLHASYWQHAGIAPRAGEDARRIIRYTSFVSGATMMFRREHIENVLPIPLDFPYEDWWISREIAQRSMIDYHPEPLILYRFHGGNRSLFL